MVVTMQTTTSMPSARPEKIVMNASAYTMMHGAMSQQNRKYDQALANVFHCSGGDGYRISKQPSTGSSSLLYGHVEKTRPTMQESIGPNVLAVPVLLSSGLYSVTAISLSTDPSTALGKSSAVRKKRTVRPRAPRKRRNDQPNMLPPPDEAKYKGMKHRIEKKMFPSIFLLKLSLAVSLSDMSPPSEGVCTPLVLQLQLYYVMEFCNRKGTVNPSLSWKLLSSLFFSLFEPAVAAGRPHPHRGRQTDR